MASSSIVHQAKEDQPHGREVVLKVRKPAVDELVQIDLEILVGLVDLVDHGRVVVLKQAGEQNVSQIARL
jgi:predicted unusual protein kinase regulating ubiquinone biosynthesis (AarF/ABC1/UbiB family)